MDVDPAGRISDRMSEQSAEPASPYRFVGMSSAYAAVHMPDGSMAEGVSDTIEHAHADAHRRWQETQ